MPERKKIGIWSLNVKKLINLHLLWNTIRKLQWGSLFFITRIILVRIWSESLPKYDSTIINSFLGTVLTRYLSIYLFMMEFQKIWTQIEAWEQQWFSWTGFVGFRYEAVEISINTTESLFPINISNKFSFFRKNVDVWKR